MQNAFYFQGGEILKIGRVILKIIEINSEFLREDSSKLNDTELLDCNKTYTSVDESSPTKIENHHEIQL